jgi:hypothetical protein
MLLVLYEKRWRWTGAGGDVVDVGGHNVKGPGEG